jgi:hypothetical protein
MEPRESSPTTKKKKEEPVNFNGSETGSTIPLERL